MKPFLKWPGGKRWLWSGIKEYLPKTFGKYYEPFVGGGAMFFALEHKLASLNDTNEWLIDCYRTVRDDPWAIDAILRGWPNTKDQYYKLRSEKFASVAARSSQLIYLTSLSFNGLYRVNFQGDFNVPYGHRTERCVLDEAALMSASNLLRHVDLTCLDFEIAVESAALDDLVYFDPPYAGKARDGVFCRYGRDIFTWEDQIRLAECARKLSERGCHVYISNALTEEIRDLYDGFGLVCYHRAQRVSGSSKHRGIADEAVFIASPSFHRKTNLSM